MKIAILGDIHSNCIALEAVLKDIEQKDVGCIIGTGDLVGYLPFPNEVISLIKQNNILCVQGNHDEAIANTVAVTKEVLSKLEPKELQANASRIYTNSVLTDENRKYLKGLPKSIVIEFEGMKVKVVHGGLEGNKHYLYEEEELLRKVAKDLQEDVLISGHTHLPYYKQVGNKHFINAGSAGKPKHGNPNATYVIIELIEQNIQVKIIEVAYDVEKVVGAIQKTPLISDALIPMLREGY